MYGQNLTVGSCEEKAHVNLWIFIRDEKTPSLSATSRIDVRKREGEMTCEQKTRKRKKGAKGRNSKNRY